MKGVGKMGLDNLPEILKVTQLAKALQISGQTIKRAIKSGELEAFKVGKEWRIEKESVIKWTKGRMEN
jgi:excisionase family DNA binding protein